MKFTQELLEWIKNLNQTTYVNINECSIYDSTMWFYDDYNGEILNRKRSFFSIKVMRRFEDDKFINEQPIIIQPEIGYLGIICKEINGVLNFLMQAKINQETLIVCKYLRLFKRLKVTLLVHMVENYRYIFEFF